MKNRFDRYNWDAKLYQTLEELDDALNVFQVKGKKLKQVRVIGMAENMEPYECRQAMRRVLHHAGIPYEDIDSGAFPRIDKTPIPCEVKICEPVVFVFEDDTTLEVKPDRGEGLLMAAGQIPPDITDGLNLSNFDSDLLFDAVKGAALDHITTIRQIIKSRSGKSIHEEKRETVTWQFWLKGNYGLSIRQSYEGWFYLSITNQRSFRDLGNETEDIPYAKMKQAAKQVAQIPMIEGHDCGGVFWIQPIRRIRASKRNWDGLTENRTQEISIDDVYIHELLSVFLEKYFDPKYPYGRARAICDPPEYDCYSHNIYTYPTVQHMLDEIEQCAHLLVTNYDDPSLDELKKRFSLYTFDLRDPDDRLSSKPLSDPEKADIIKANIRIALDFYERFVSRMRKMIAASSEYTAIDFQGP